MGALAALGDALSWAIAGTFITSKLAHIDSISVATVRTVFAAAFVWAAVFVLGGQGDLWRMDFDTMWQLTVAGLLIFAIGEPTYVLTLAFLGLTRGYTAVIGLFSLGAFILPAILLDEPVTLRASAGAVLILVGVYTVAVYGRACPTMQTAAAGFDLPAAGLGQLPPTLFLGSNRTDASADVGLRLPLKPPASATGRRWRRRPPIAGGSGIAAPSTAVRIPVLGIALPRLLLGALFALATGLAWAGDTTWLRSVAPGFDASAVAVVHLSPAAILMGTSLLLGRRGRLFTAGFTPRIAGLIGLTGAFTTGLGTILIVFAVQKIGAGPTAVLFATSSIFALPLAAIFLHERVTIWGVLGAFVAIGGIALLA